MPRLYFLLPGDPAARTGGYAYARRMVDGLRTLGWEVAQRTLDAGFPDPSPAAIEHARDLLAGIPDDERVLIDGLALGAMPELVQAERDRLRLIALIHHPLAEETGLPPQRSAELRRSERAGLGAVTSIVVTSRYTQRLLGDYGVGPGRITVIEPGTDDAPLARGSGGGALEILCVATLTPRKGHSLLIDALSALDDRDWRLTCVGSLERSPETVAGVRDRIAALGLADRVRLPGVVDDAALARCYDRADLFVLASWFEGYGMSVAEAVARGLPIVATNAGALPDTAPSAGSLLVPPGDSPALSAALARLIDDPAERVALAAGARAARERLPSWDQAADRMAAALLAVGAR